MLVDDPLRPGRIPQMISPREVARRLRINRLRLYELCRRGEIPGVWRDGETWKIPETAVLEYLDRMEARTRIQVAATRNSLGSAETKGTK